MQREGLLIRKLKNLDLTLVKLIASSFATFPQPQYPFAGLRAVHPWMGRSWNSKTAEEHSKKGKQFKLRHGSRRRLIIHTKFVVTWYNIY